NWGLEYKSDEGPGTGSFLTHAWISMLAVLPIVAISVLLCQMDRGAIRIPNALPQIATHIKWGKDHPFLRFLLITFCLLVWFGAVAFLEFRYLNYSAIVVVGYLQVIVAGFFIERTSLVEKITNLPEHA